MKAVKVWKGKTETEVFRWGAIIFLKCNLNLPTYVWFWSGFAIVKYKML